MSQRTLEKEIRPSQRASVRNLPATSAVYRRVLGAREPDGRLRTDFRLTAVSNREEELEKLAMLAGCGIDEDGTRMLAGAVRLVGRGLWDLAEDLVTDFVQKGGAFYRCVGSVPAYLRRNAGEIDMARVNAYGRETIVFSADLQRVKFALICLAGAPGKEEAETGDALELLALCPELSFYAVPALRAREDGACRVCRVAQSAEGWAKLFAISGMLPETPEAARWMLAEGWRIPGLTAYAAPVCAARGGLSELLEKAVLTREEFRLAEDLIKAIVNGGDEEASPGLFWLDGGADITRNYLRHATKMPLDQEGQKIVSLLYGIAQGERMA